MENKIELYNRAKEAYYAGNPIMTDMEFDELESELGLENKSYVGTRHNPSYTEKHPYIMGSLSKVQIKENADGTVDWEKYFEEMSGYVFKKYGNVQVIASPKYDGCSFECVVKNRQIKSISSRGDGTYGKDLYLHISDKLLHTVQYFNNMFDVHKDYVLRGEVLINKDVFESKYSEYVNPRSFVAGILGSDYESTDEFIDKLNDLSVVVYEIRVLESDKTVAFEYDIDEFSYPTAPSFYYRTNIRTAEDFARIYRDFEKYRKDCEFALDGFVIKPIQSYRELNMDRQRPSDCIAIKFIPMLEETVVEDIIWSTRKTNELIPVIVVKPVTMDGKQVTRASAHNYGYLIDNKISIGTRLVLSLAGDIIPFIYKVTDTSDFSESNLNLPSEISTEVDGCHLYHIISDYELKRKRFINSAMALNIPGIGNSSAEKLFDYIENEYKGDEFFGIPERELPDNILLLTAHDVERGIDGKNGVKASKEFEKILSSITIKEIINSLTIEDCGTKISEAIEKYILTGNADFSHLTEKAYSWVFNKKSENWKRFSAILEHLNKTEDDFKENIQNSIDKESEKIPVILTGEPNDYASKAEFLKCHPEYRMTGSWKECQIVFTNSLESRTGKMKKAIEKGIEIRVY